MRTCSEVSVQAAEIGFLERQLPTTCSPGRRLIGVAAQRPGSAAMDFHGWPFYAPAPDRRPLAAKAVPTPGSFACRVTLPRGDSR
jgi:hypothetical protein